MIQFDDHIFQLGWMKPPTSPLFPCKFQSYCSLQWLCEFNLPGLWDICRSLASSHGCGSSLAGWEYCFVAHGWEEQVKHLSRKAIQHESWKTPHCLDYTTQVNRIILNRCWDIPINQPAGEQRYSHLGCNLHRGHSMPGDQSWCQCNNVCWILRDVPYNSTLFGLVIEWRLLDLFLLQP